jgi:hypothetical protein
VICLNIQNILFTLEENAIHHHRFGPPTGIPRRHRRQEEAAPHLHTGDNKSKS